MWPRHLFVNQMLGVHDHGIIVQRLHHLSVCTNTLSESICTQTPHGHLPQVAVIQGSGDLRDACCCGISHHVINAVVTATFGNIAYLMAYFIITVTVTTWLLCQTVVCGGVWLYTVV